MNIAHVLPHSVRFPLKTHNGRYNWVRQLVALQVEAGHTVTVYCHPNSELDGVTIRGIREPSDQDRRHNNIETFRLAFRETHDVYHSHFDELHYEVAHETSRPIIVTQHWWPTERMIELAQTAGVGNVWAVPPTRFMSTFDQSVGIQSKGYIHHGIDLSRFHPADALKNNRLLFVGRISPEKNLETALIIAEKTGFGLDIIGKVTPKNQAYWDGFQDRIDGTRIRYHGPKNQSELIGYYQAALGVLCPYDVTEAFGLVSIEAQACGTPLVMKRGGSRSELIIEGETGFLCETDEAFVDAAKKLTELSPAACVAFAQNFDVRDMATAYDTLYKEVLD